MKTKLRFFMTSALLAVLTIGNGQLVHHARAADATALTFRTAILNRADVQATVSAKGTLEPEEVVEVGVEIAGRIVRLGHDPRDATKTIDSGSAVDEGTELAQINDSLYRTQVVLAQASCDRSVAELQRVEVKLAQAARRWEQTQELLASKTTSEADAEKARDEFEVAKADVAVAKAATIQSRTTLELAETNLASTKILSPIRGVILTRQANVGQMVSPGPNVPCLFLIAKDRLQVWASVAEEDIDRIRPGQAASFTVDGHRRVVFGGKVGQIRLNATRTRDGATYTVVVGVDNSDRRLLPYRTAHVKFDVERRDNVLTVPNAALRWWPRPEWVLPDYRDEVLHPRQTLDSRSAKSGTEASPAPTRSQRVWVRDGDFVCPIEVQTGITDGTLTEITHGDVKENTEVVIGNTPSAGPP